MDLSAGSETIKKMKPNYFDECSPIKNLDEISEMVKNPPNWVDRVLPRQKRSNMIVQNYISDCHTEYGKLIPKPRIDRRFTPKTLVCHDYKGGYLNDKYLIGTTSGNQYTFYNWAHIDIFIYFSHHLITIPPLCWINAAHRNGVKILGTFITEFKEGEKICEKIFKDEDTMRIFATELTQIAQIFKFDGWLLNIENPIIKIDLLKQFISYLTVSIHNDNSEGLVLWYDSVTEKGELHWQNALNELNKGFFDNCDGIFLNYVWNEDGIKKSAQIAEHRNLDIYVGIDIFGRNTFGGGKFNAYKAAQIIRRYNLSMAIFAPGWTHETLDKGSLDTNKFFQQFIDRDSAFWNSLWPYLYTHPITNCFKTQFYIGIDQVFYNIFSQEQQLTKLKHPKHTSSEYSDVHTLSIKCKCLQTDYKDNELKLLITKEHLNSTLCFNHRLFSCDINLVGEINLFIITEQQNEIANFGLTLLICYDNDCFKLIKLNSIVKEKCIENATLLEVNPSEDINLIGAVTRSYNSLVSPGNRDVLVYQLALTSCTLLEIGGIFDKGKSIYLCAFGIKQADNSIYF